MPPARSLRVAQICAAASHSPWFTNICAELTRRGFEVVAIIDASEGDLGARLEAQGVRYHRVPMYFGRNLDRIRLLLYLIAFPYVIGRLVWILRRERIAVAHSHIFVANVVTRLACLLARVPHVAGIAAPRHLEAPLTRAVERLTCGADALVVCGCEYAASLYRNLGVPAERIAVAYYGSPPEAFDPAAVDAERFRRELGVAPGTPLVGLVAHFYPPMRGPQAPRATQGVGLKGHDVFLDAARLVARRVPQARFVLVGEGFNELGERYRQSLIERCRADGLIERVYFADHRSDIQRVLASFDVAVQCSLTEGLGGTIEALLMERPTVATFVGGMPEAVRDGQTGLLVPPADAPSLAAAIERLLGDRQDARRLAAAGRALMLDRFTLSRTGSDLAAAYARVTVQEYDSAARPARAVEELLDVAAHAPLVLALIGRNVKVRYKRSVFGVAWTMAQPVTLLLVLTLIFARAFAPSAPAYALYLAPGLILWHFFAQTTSVVIAEVAAGVELWRRVRMPRTALAIATTCSGLLNLAMATIPLAVVVALAGVPLGASVLTLPVTALVTAIFALGIGLAIAAVAIYFPDAADLYQMLLVPWMFVTPVIYPRAILPSQVDRVIGFNPMAWFVEAFRRPLQDNASASPAAFGLMAGVAVVTLAIGFLVFTRCADDVPYRG